MLELTVNLKGLTKAVASNDSVEFAITVKIEDRSDTADSVNADDLVAAFASNRFLKDLKFHGSYNVLTDVFFQTLAAAIDASDSLERISVYGTTLLGDAGTKALAEVLQKKQKIISIYLSGGKIGDVGASALAGTVQENKNIVSLQLHKNCIGDEGAKKLACAIRANRSLTILNLNDNPISDSAVGDLVSALEENKTILTFYVTTKDHAIKKKIDTLIKRNRALVNELEEAIVDKKDLSAVRQLVERGVSLGFKENSSSVHPLMVAMNLCDSVPDLALKQIIIFLIEEMAKQGIRIQDEVKKWTTDSEILKLIESHSTVSGVKRVRDTSPEEEGRDKLSDEENRAIKRFNR